MQIKVLIYIVGAFFILTGLFVPSSTLIEYLVATPVDLLKQNSPIFTEKLLLGATLFKLGLVTFGILVIALGGISIWKSEIQCRKSESNKHKRVALVILLSLLMAALAIRLYGLNNQLWYDEMLTYDKFMHMPIGKIISVYYSDNNHILYTLFARASFWIFGESSWSLRLPAVIFGIGSIWALYLLGRTISTTRVGLLSAALLAFSYQHIWFSQNARGYTALLFWTLISSWLLIRGLRDGRRDFWLLYALTAALGVFTHITMLFVVFGQFIVYLLMLISQRKTKWPQKWHGLFFGFCIAGYFIFQLHALMLPQMFKVFTFSTVNVRAIAQENTPDVSPVAPGLKEWKNPLWTLKEFIKGMEMSLTDSMLASAALVLFGVVFIAGLLHFKHKDPIIILLLIIPVIIGSIVVIAGGYPLFPRFYFFTIGFIVLIVVQGAITLGDIINRRLNIKYSASFPLGTGLCILLILASAVSIPAVYAPKQDYLGALNYVQEVSDPGDAIVTVGLTRFPYKKYYNRDWEKAGTLEELNSIRSQVKRTWLLYTLPLPLKSKNPEIMDSIQHDFEVVKQFPGTLNGGTIVVCRSDSPPSPIKTFSTKVRGAQSLPHYGVFELTFEHSGIYNNNFFDVAINAIFTSPSGIKHNVKGFYYRNDLWKVRFSPDEVGDWRYEYIMNGSGGFSKEGEGGFEATASDKEGRILRNPKKTYRWIFANGKPYFPLGLQDCIYTEGPELQDITIDGIKVIDKVKRVSVIYKGKRVSLDEYFFVYGQAGFNLFRFSQRNCSYSLYDDLDHFREDESIATDRLLMLARKYGFRVMFGFFGYHGEWPNGKTTEAIMAPDDYETVAKEKRFIDYCIARWGVYVDFWELLNEREATDKWTSIMADYVRSVDPYDKPISTTWARLYFNLPAIDLTSPHWYSWESTFQADLSVKHWATLWKKPGKPVIVGEQGHGGSNWGPLSGERMRIRTWTALFQEISFIFWHTGIWYEAEIAANIYLGPEERGYTKVLQDFSSKLDAEVRMIPVEVSSEGVRAYGLLSDTVAATYLHHFESHDSLINDVMITLDLPDSGYVGEKLIGKWIDPSTGNVVAGAQVSPGRQTLKVPAFTIDIALIVTYQSR